MYRLREESLERTFDLGGVVELVDVGGPRRRRRRRVRQVSLVPHVPQLLGDLGGRDSAGVVSDQTQQEDTVDVQELLGEATNLRVVAHRPRPLRLRPAALTEAV